MSTYEICNQCYNADKNTQENLINEEIKNINSNADQLYISNELCKTTNELKRNKSNINIKAFLLLKCIFFSRNKTKELVYYVK